MRGERLKGASTGLQLASVVSVLMLALELASMPARGALFDDDEARKRIDALKVRVDQLERSLQQRLDTLESKSTGLVDVLRDVEQIKADVAKLRGQYEVLSYELEQTQKRQRDLYVDLDTRLRKLEGGPGAPGASEASPPASGAPAASAPPARPGDASAEQRAYDTALEQFKGSN